MGIKHDLPYKSIYLKESLVAENKFCALRSEAIQPKSLKEVKEILPLSI